ncbi:MAG TPA: hypothetical protein VH231_07980 [Solirubrobacteraceae bacterium]|nr:hypothetical protein [Solirubrobacteraceae bacterium]
MTAPRLIVPLLAAAVGVFGGYTLMHSVGPNVGGGSGTKDSAGVVIDDSSGPPLDLYIIPGGKLYSRDTSPIPPNALVLKEALPVSKISTTGPARMVRTLRRKSGIMPDEVNYLVSTVDPITHKATWNLYLKDSSDFYRAAINGAHPTRCC